LILARSSPTRAAWLALLYALPACQCRFDPADSAGPGETGETGWRDTGDPWADDGATHTWRFLEEGRLNALLPLHVAVDPEARRIYASSLHSGSIAVIDPDERRLLDVIDPGYGGGYSGLATGPAGTLWLLRQQAMPALVRLRPASGELTPVETGLTSAAGLLARSDGSLLVTGSQGDDEPVVQLLDADLNLLESWLPDLPARGIVPVGEDRFAILYGWSDGHVTIYDMDSLEEVQECTAPVAGSTLTLLSGGDFVSASDAAMGIAGCSSGSSVARTAGTENKSTIAWEDGFFVFDRIGLDDPNWAEARWYDAGLRPGEQVHVTGKNSGYAVQDTRDGLVWVNSEGTTEVLAMDLATGAIAHRVRVGVHLESVAGDPEHPWRLYVTGRLSNTLAIADLRDDSLREVLPAFDWPVAPTVAQGELWVLDQLTSRLHRLAGGSLEELAAYDLGLPENATLTISDMALHPARGTLFVTHGPSNSLVEVDPGAGAVLHTWALGGEPLGPDDPGRLELAIGAHDVYAVRCFDGRISRIDPDLDRPVATAAPLAGLLSPESRMQMSALSEDEQLLYLGGWAIDTATLERDPAHDRPWSIPIVQEQGFWLAWRDADSSLVVYDSSGQPVTTRPTALTEHGGLSLRWMPWCGGRVVFTDLDAAVLTVLPIAFPPVEKG
jgi:DNA-binding beta-propeller fold protein YncE